MTVTVVDYGRGNLFSLGQALRHLGADFALAEAPAALATATRIVLPGVGAFGDCMEGLRERGLVDPLIAAVRDRGVPFLGICVGMQIMASQGEEFGRHAGLGLVAGTVRRLPDPAAPRGRLRVPNVGWRTLRPRSNAGFLDGVAAGTLAYFVHSYALDPADPADVSADFDFNGAAVPAIVKRGGMIGFQFHPEKSGAGGLELLRRFLAMPAGG